MTAATLMSPLQTEIQTASAIPMHGQAPMGTAQEPLQTRSQTAIRRAALHWHMDLYRNANDGSADGGGSVNLCVESTAPWRQPI